ncbi:MAG: WecB/TagA/CpsF family glycosyltransferase [Actinobacteria bacterium]|nr:WecB/TagA/CpsF family glycosyltransferase [Actinomycetota bacterium]
MRDLGKRNVLGVLVDAVDREAAVEKVVRAARQRKSLQVTALAVHGVMTGNRDILQRNRLNRFDLVLPDGQPVRWALNVLHRTKLGSSVRGTDVTIGVLAAAEREGLAVLFYGSRRETLDRMVARVEQKFPDLQVAGSKPSLFRAIDEKTQATIADELRDSGAEIIFVGLGCPRQETFVHAMSERVGVPMIAVGAAFDYLAGTLLEPPILLRRWGLEWAWRLLLEPRRLWRRYLLLNPAYLGLLTLQALGVYRPAAPARGAAGIGRLDA